MEKVEGSIRFLDCPSTFLHGICWNTLYKYI